MTIICHRRQFIFLKSRKTAGTSIELWLAPNLDPEVDLISTGIEFRQQYPDVWKSFNSPSRRIRFALRRALTFTPIFRPHMYAAEVRSFVGDRTWRNYCKISIVRDPLGSYHLTVAVATTHQRRFDYTLRLCDCHGKRGENTHA